MNLERREDETLGRGFAIRIADECESIIVFGRHGLTGAKEFVAAHAERVSDERP